MEPGGVRVVCVVLFLSLGGPRDLGTHNAVMMMMNGLDFNYSSVTCQMMKLIISFF